MCGNPFDSPDVPAPPPPPAPPAPGPVDTAESPTLGSEQESQARRKSGKKKRGRGLESLRIKLNTPNSSGSGLSIPQD